MAQERDLAALDAAGMIEGYRQGRFTPVDVMAAVLERMEKVNPLINAFCFADAEGAMAAAGKSAARWRGGNPAGPLDGVPFTIKDLVLSRGWPTLRGSRTISPEQPWEDDAPSVARLRRAGGIAFAKTTTPEFGWKGVTDSPLTGITRNPWNTERTPGGSSGGAAAAAAAGVGPLHIGTDGGGSIRIPAAFCGVVGHKPSAMRVAAWPPSPFGTLATVGPITRSVRDAALMLDCMSGPDPRDWLTHEMVPVAQEGRGRANSGRRRIAFSPDLGFAKVDEEVAEAVRRAVLALEDAGFTIEEVPPPFEDPTEIFIRHWAVGAYNGLRVLSEDQLAMLEAPLQEVVEMGRKTALSDYLDAMNARVALGTRMRAFHEDFDLLLTPALAVTAFRVGRLMPDEEDVEKPSVLAARGLEEWLSWTPFTYPFNLTGQPAITLPCGLSAEGLPVGLQIVGPAEDDGRIFAFARQAERIVSALMPQRLPDL